MQRFYAHTDPASPINAQLASNETGTGFSDDDAQQLKKALLKFEGDASSARPEGTMEVKKVVWWKHTCASGDISSAKVHRSLAVSLDGSVTAPSLTFQQDEREGTLTPEVTDGFERQGNGVTLIRRI